MNSHIDRDSPSLPVGIKLSSESRGYDTLLPSPKAYAREENVTLESQSCFGGGDETRCLFHVRNASDFSRSYFWILYDANGFSLPGAFGD